MMAGGLLSPNRSLPPGAYSRGHYFPLAPGPGFCSYFCWVAGAGEPCNTLRTTK